MDDFGQEEDMAKQNVLFAGSGGQGFSIVKDTHLHDPGGLLHR